ncbi:MAG: hypothetical protein IKS15_03480 [Opitutales bacterium]|nr:hypothetical protein [Opitutales bacterium]
MSNKSKCPYCNATITRLNVEEIELERGAGGPWKGVSYACPVCRKILSVNISPEAFKHDVALLIQQVVLDGKKIK